MSISSISYPPVPDGPPHALTTHRMSGTQVMRIRLHGADLPEDRAALEFRLRSVLGVANVKFRESDHHVPDVFVTRKPDFPWEVMRIRVCDRLVEILGWQHHNTTVDGSVPNWFSRAGIVSF